MFEIKIIRSPYGNFYHREIEDCNKSYPDKYLKEISEQEFNSIWLHCLLKDIVKSSVFPQFGEKEKEQTYQLNKLVERSDKFGIKVYLYFNEPRGLKENDNFWKKHPDVKGQPHPFGGEIGDLKGRYFALCSSTQKVKDFLYESSYNLFKKVKGLGGVILITASEFHTHCYSHYIKHSYKFENTDKVDWSKYGFYCKKCEKREPYEVVSEIIKLIRNGIKDASPQAKIICWTWSWSIVEPDPQPKLIKSLPKDIILMSDFERGGYKFINKKRHFIDEYSLSYIGPSPRFKKQLYLAKRSNLKIMAKLQFSTTHEIVTVPYIPVIFNFAEKIEKLKKLRANGYLYCWIFGGKTSIVSKLTGILSTKDIPKYKVIKMIAEEEFGKNLSKFVIKGWKIFSESFKNYPFSIPFMYNGPINYATVYPFKLNAEKTDIIPSWRPLPREKGGFLKVGDNFETWVAPYTPDFFITQLEKLAKEWKKGIEILETGYRIEPNERLKKEIDIATHIYFSFKSTSNIIKFYLNLRKWKKNGRGPLKKILEILKEEVEITEKDKKIWERNHEFGYHPEAAENFIKLEDFEYKLKLLKQQIQEIEKN